jgi:hypothetical protein
MADRGVLEYFIRNSDLPAERAVDGAMQGKVVQQYETYVVYRGNGVGATIDAELAFAIFGPHARALPLLFVALLGASTAAFLVRFQQAYLSAIPIIFTALTVLLLTSISNDPANMQVPIGGIRYYAVVGILPTLHWMLELFGNHRPSNPWIRWSALAIQLAILGLAILVRGSPA